MARSAMLVARNYRYGTVIPVRRVMQRGVALTYTTDGIGDLLMLDRIELTVSLSVETMYHGATVYDMAARIKRGDYKLLLCDEYNRVLPIVRTVSASVDYVEVDSCDTCIQATLEEMTNLVRPDLE